METRSPNQEPTPGPLGLAEGQVAGPDAGADGGVVASAAGSQVQGRGRWETLLSLLDDDSPVVLAGVRSEFERAGRAGTRALRRGLASGSARLRGRARQLLVEGARREVTRRLVRRAVAGVDLESALFLLDSYSAPRLDARPYKKALDAMADKVRAEASTRRTTADRARALVDVLAGELGFQGAVDDFHHPDNISLWRTIERKRGMPLTLCAVYSFVARRAGLRTALLPFPGHVLLRLQPLRDRKGQIVDPFGGGQALSETQCLSYLADHRLPFRAEWFEPATDAALFERHVRNLVHSCRARGRIGEARQLGRVLAALVTEKGPARSHGRTARS